MLFKGAEVLYGLLLKQQTEKEIGLEEVIAVDTWDIKIP